MLHAHLEKNKMANEEGHNHLLLELFPQAAEKPKPVSIVLVIDVSSSMEAPENSRFLQPLGPSHPHEPRTKLQWVKQAAETLLDRMHEGDQLGLISFAREAVVEFPLQPITAENRFFLKQCIRSLAARDATNISGGLHAAFQQIPNENHAKLLLLSDGKANHGIQDAAGFRALVSRFRKKGVSIAAMGVGSDVHKPPLPSIATCSGPFFVPFTGKEELEEQMIKEVAQLRDLSIKHARIAIQVPEGVYAALPMHGLAEDAEGNVWIGHLDQSHHLLYHLHTGETVTPGVKKVVVTYQYQDEEDHLHTVKTVIPLRLATKDQMADVKINPSVAAFAKSLVNTEP